MATILHPKNFLQFLHCSCPEKAPLIWTGEKAICQSCHKVFPITENILELVDVSLLDAETARELKGNTKTLTPENIKDCTNKDNWNDYYSHMSYKKFKYLVQYLKLIDCERLFSLGSGYGFEIKCLSTMHKFDTVFCSDLSYSYLCINPYMLEQTDIKIGLFTSNLDECPIQSKDIPILIYEALHHTQDMHTAIERLLIEGYKNILFAEPTNNFVIHWLAKKGVAQRVEYSGVKPGRMELPKLDELCQKYGYKSFVTTTWDFPEDYLRKICKTSGWFQDLLVFLIDALGLATRPFRFGNGSVVHLQKI